LIFFYLSLRAYQVWYQKMRVSFVLIFLCVYHISICQHSLSGKIEEEKTGNPIEYASVEIVGHELWAITNEKGEFLLKNVSKGEIRVKVSCLGYAPKTFNLKVSGDMRELMFYLPQNNLALQEVVITAQNKSDGMATSYVIDRAGLDHLQMLGVSDVMGLLPGGRTNRNLHMATNDPHAQTIALRSVAGENGNPTFGTAIEVDGVRLSNNTIYDTSTSIYGTDTRNIASGNIESVELVTGVASVEYGDMSTGIVKINTRKGKSPLIIEMATKPNTKQAAANKGFGLGAGVLNASIEYTKSVSDLASPYTSYDRNSASLLYENTFNKNSRPLMLTAGISGNVGGYDSKADPDAFSNNYEKEKSNTLRTHFKLNYLLNNFWITNIELSGSVVYSNKFREKNVYKSSSSSTPAIHGKEEGYFVASQYDEDPNAAVLLIPSGHWYELEYVDNKPLDLAGNFKIKQAHKFGRINNNLMFGINATVSKNEGKSDYFGDMRLAPTWREYRYDEIPAMNNVAFYLEEKMTIPVYTSLLQLTGGLRSDMTFINHSEYGNVGSLSPRVNAKYTVKSTPDAFFKRFNIRAGWGKFTKLPSFAVLYPQPTYRDILSFAPGAMSDGTIFYAYYIMPSKPQYNSNLHWQYTNQLETGLEVKIKGATINLSAYYNKTFDSYQQTTTYLPFAYKFTGQSALENFPVSSENRKYTINQTTGVVTVSDKTGQHPSQELAYNERKTFKSAYQYINASPTVRKGLEWIVDFDKIQAIGTTIRFDGSYYNYRSTEETQEAYSPTSQNMADGFPYYGAPYQYVGIYTGGHNVSNGSETRRLNANLTFTTHIPTVRLIISLKIESSLYNYSQRLSEYEGKARGFALDGRDSYFPAADRPGNIYNTDRYVAVYPDYYVSYEDMNTLIPFAEKFAWAKENDLPLYRELAKLVVTSNTDYFFNAARLSGYYSANISITKEIGDIASLSFNATNFTNNMQLVKSSDTGIQSTIFGSSYIPRFYYGLSLRIKINQ
jgi:hypothetical protein